jgi:hypothetical protein
MTSEDEALSEEWLSRASHLALVVALVIGFAFTDRLHAQAAPAPISENPTAIPH